MIFKTFDSDINKISSKVGILGKSFDGIFESYQNWKNKIDDLSDPLKGGTLTKNQAKQQVGGLFSYIFSDHSNDALVEEFETFKKMMLDYGMTAEEVAKDLGDQLNPHIQSYVKSAKNGEISTNGFKKAIGDLSFEAKASALAMNVLSMAGNILASVLISIAVQAVIKYFDDLAHAQEYAMQRSSDLTAKYKDEQSSIQDSISKYEELGKKLEDTSLSASEVKSVKEQLMAVQDGLNEKYGSEATQIDLVNGKYDEQIAKLNELSKKKAKDFVAENYKDNKADTSYVKDVMNFSTSLGFSGDRKNPLKNAGFDLKKFIDKYDNLGLDIDSDGFNTESGNVSLITRGTRKEAYDALSKLSDDLLKTYGTQNEYVNKVREQIAETLDKEFDLSKIAEAESNMKEYAKAVIDQNDKASKSYKNLDDTIEKYNDALRSGNGVEAAKKNLLDAKDAVEDVTSSIDNADMVLQDEYKKLSGDASIEMKIKFKVDGWENLDKVYRDTIYRFQSGENRNTIKNFFDEKGINTEDEINEFNRLTTGITNAEEAIKKFNSYSISPIGMKTQEEMDTFKESIDSAVTSYNNLNAAILAQETGKTITMTDELAEYTDCLEYNNGVMQINTERAREKAKATAEEKLATIEAQEAQERYQYALNTEKIQRFTEALGSKNSVVVDGVEITRAMIQDLEDNNSQIVENAKSYELMASQIRQATGSYQAWLDAQNAPDQGTMFTDAGNAAKAIIEGLGNGKIGTEKFKAAVEFIMPDDIDPKNKEQVQKYLDKVKRYLADNGSGVNNFIDDSISKGLINSLGNGEYKFADGVSIQDFMDKLNLTEEVVRSMLGEMETYGITPNLTGDFDSLDEALFNAQTQYDELKKSLEDQGFKVNVDDENLRKLFPELDKAGKEIDSLSNKVYDSVVSLKENQDFSSIRNDYQQLLESQKVFNASLSSGDSQSIVNTRQELNDLTSKLAQKYDLKIDDGDAKSVLDNLQNQMLQISGLNEYTIQIADTEAKKKLEDLKSQLENINSQINEINNKPVSKRDSDQLNSLKKQKQGVMQQISDQQAVVDWIADVKLELDMDSVNRVKKEKDDVGKDEVQIKVDKTQIEAAESALTKLKDLIAEINNSSVNLVLPGGMPKSSGSNKKSNTTSQTGIGEAWGTPDIGQAQTSLIGELGREIVVDPANGSWRTYGDNGAEFAQLPKHAIVFNHKQTESLLKRGFVNSRGLAFASGNAYAKGVKTSISKEDMKFSKVDLSGKDSISEAEKTAKKAKESTDKLTKSTKDAAKAEENLVDWIDRRITLLNNQKSLLEKQATDAYRSYFGMTESQFNEISGLMADPNNLEKYGEGVKKLSDIARDTGISMESLFETIRSGKFEQSRLGAIESQLEIDKQLIDTISSSIPVYQQKYEEYAAKLPQGYREKIEKGDLTLENFAKETSKDGNSGNGVYDNLQKAIEYYDKMKSKTSDLEDATQTYHKTLEEKHNTLITYLEKENTLLQNQADLIQKGIDLAKESGHVVTASMYEDLIANNKEQINNAEKTISQKRDELADLDPNVDTEKYQDLKSEIIQAEGNLKALRTNQAKLNKELKEMPITNMTTVINMYKDISTAIQNWGAELEASGTALTADYYQELIKNGSTIINEYKKQADVIQDVMDTYDVGSDNWNELYSQLQNVNGEMSSMIQNLKKWNEELLQLPLTKISNYSSNLNTVKDALSSLQDDYSTVISAVTGAIDDETKAIQDQQKEFQKNIEKQKDAIQDKIDLLDKQNTKLQLQNQLEQSLYDLQIANTQKTQKIIRNGEEIYVTDADKIREAQKAYQDAQYSKTKNDLQEQLDALNDQLDDYNDKVDEQIEALDKIKEKWSEIAENVTEAQNATLATDYLGAGWKDKVLSGNDADIYNAFKNQYEQNASQIQMYEKQIESTEKIYSLLNEYVDAYKAGTISYEATKSAIENLTSQLNKNLDANTNLANTLKYAQLVTGANGQSVEQVLAGIQSDIATSGANLITSLEKYQQNSKLISEQTSSWQQLTNNVAEMLSVLKDVRKNLKKAERDDDEDEDDDDSGSSKKHHTSKTDGPGKSSWSNKDENNGPGAEINRKKAGIAHDGLAAGVVGKNGETSSEAWLKAHGLQKLDAKEYPYILKLGEQVINEEQRQTLMSNVKNAYSSAYADGVKRGINAAASAMNQVNNKTYTVNAPIGKIVLENVQNSQDLAEDLMNNFKMTMAQQFSKFYR